MQQFFAIIISCLLFWNPAFLVSEECSQNTRAAFSLPTDKRYYLAATAVFQNEAPYLREWLEYHRLVGVEHFYLYNNLSTDDYMSVLQSYIDEGFVDIVNWPVGSADFAIYGPIQLDIYRDALRRADCHWLVVLDSDEYFVPNQHDSLPELLHAFDNQPDIGGVILPWIFFGTSNVAKIPEDQLMIETLLNNGGLWPYPDRALWPLQDILREACHKSIVRPYFVSHVPHPHHFYFPPGIRNLILWEDIGQVNHYWTRDEHYLYTYKIPRRENWGTPTSTVLRNAALMNCPTDFHLSIQRFVPELRRRMGFREQ
ncbi:MAG: glycosyltransferase family 92 protein [Chlamydiia bacterium]|nr:glycosyltransferase family 92 protein [Chlamydiia bacterium]